MKWQHIFGATLPKKVVPGKPCYKNIRIFFVHVIKVFLIDSGLGRDHFLGEAQAQSVRRSAYTWSIVDRLDIFSITNSATETLNCSKIRFSQLYQNEKQMCNRNYHHYGYLAISSSNSTCASLFSSTAVFY